MKSSKTAGNKKLKVGDVVGTVKNRKITVCDPATVWNRKKLYQKPQSFDNLPGNIRSVFIEGEPFKGKKTRIFAYYGIPEWATPENPAPAIILVHGGAGTAYREWVRLWVERGYAAICVDNCGAVPVRMPDGGSWMRNPDGGPAGWGNAYNTINKDIRDDWVYHAVAAVMRSCSYLCSFPNVSKKNIGLTGISWGAFLTCTIAAADTRYAYAIPVYGCGFNYERDGLLDMHKHADHFAQMWEPIRFLPFVKCPMLWVDGTNDFAFALNRVVRSAALAPVKHAFTTKIRMVHGHGAPGEGPEEIRVFADSFAKGLPPLVEITAAEVKNQRLAAKFNAHGRNIVRAELNWTTDGADKKWDVRFWNSQVINDFNAQSGKVSVKLPANTFAAYISLITNDGLIVSTRYWENA